MKPNFLKIKYIASCAAFLRKRFFYESLTKLDLWVDRHRIKVSKSYLNWNPSKSYRSSTHINPFRFAKQIAILCSMIRLAPLCTSPGAAAVKWHKGLSIASKGHFEAHSADISSFIFWYCKLDCNLMFGSSF